MEEPLTEEDAARGCAAAVGGQGSPVVPPKLPRMAQPQHLAAPQPHRDGSSLGGVSATASADASTHNSGQGHPTATPSEQDGEADDMIAEADGFMSLGGTLADRSGAPIIQPPTPRANPAAPRPPPSPTHDTPLLGGKDILHDNALTRRIVRQGAGDFRTGGSLLWHALNDGNPDAVDALLTSKYDVNLRHHNCETPLHLAIRTGDMRTAVRLLECGANQTQLGPSGYAALHYAAHFDQPTLASMLIQRGASLEAANGVTGQTPLYIAARGGSAAVAGLLIQHGADANAREGNMRRTPAHGAAERNYTEVIKLLLEASVDFNRTDRDGFTPLHLAAKANAAEAVAILVKAPAVNVGQRMGTLSWVGGGWSAADLAKSAGHQQVAQLIAESIEARKRNPITY